MKQKNKLANLLFRTWRRKQIHDKRHWRTFPWHSAFFWTWLVVSVILFIPAYLFLHFNLGWPTPITVFRSLITGEPQSPTTFSAKRNLHIFTVLMQTDIEVQSPSHTHDAEEQELLGRITLREYKAGDQINLRELGPQLSSGVNYQVQEIEVPDSLSWLKSGDITSFVLTDTSCLSSTQNTSSATPTSSSTTPACSPAKTTETNSYYLLDTVILENGTMEKNGLMSFLIAIPIGENQGVLPMLDRNAGNIIANLLVDVP